MDITDTITAAPDISSPALGVGITTPVDDRGRELLHYVNRLGPQQEEAEAVRRKITLVDDTTANLAKAKAKLVADYETLLAGVGKIQAKIAELSNGNA
jgi:hypothetical protein